MIVVDASVVVTALGDDGPDGLRARTRIQGDDLMAPHLIDLEVVSAWRRMAHVGDLGDRRVEQAIEDLEVLRLDRVPHTQLLSRCWQLRSNLTVYDAVYVALAELSGAILLTADAKLAASPGATCAIELIA